LELVKAGVGAQLAPTARNEEPQGNPHELRVAGKAGVMLELAADPLLASSATGTVVDRPASCPTSPE
jgi:hypothetical protein